MTFGLRLTCVLISQNDLSHKFENSSLSGGLQGGSMLCFIGQQHDCNDTYFWKGGKKTVNFFGGQKLEVCYHASYLYINRVCRFVRFSWKLPWMFLRYYHTKVHIRLEWNLKYFSHNLSEFDIKGNPTSQYIFSGTNGNIEIAWHSLL